MDQQGILILVGVIFIWKFHNEFNQNIIKKKMSWTGIGKIKEI